MTAPIDTAKIPTGNAGRRELHFHSVDEALAEFGRLESGAREGRLTSVGNWTLGQAFGHLAAWCDYAYDGYPKTLRVSWPVRAVMRLLMKKKFFDGPMPQGVKIPGVAGGTLATESLSLQEGAARVRRAFERLKKERPTQENVLFGTLTHEDWIRLNLRHAELHLGYFRY
jgi:hypothetical protein